MRAKIDIPKIGTKAQRPKSSQEPPRRSAERKRGEPLYVQLANALKKDIVDGVFPVGSLLPTEDELCARFSVSRYTVREALRRLREDNLVSSRQGAGTVVVPQRTADAYSHDVMSIDDLVSWSAGQRFVVESLEMITIDERTAARMDLTRGEQWLVARGWGYKEDLKQPVCWAEYFIRREFAAVGRLLHRHVGPIFPLIEDLFGQRIAEVHQEIGATLISPAIAEALKVKPGSAGLEVRRSFVLSSGEVAQVTMSTHPASRYRHSMTMRRIKA